MFLVEDLQYGVGGSLGGLGSALIGATPARFRKLGYEHVYLTSSGKRGEGLRLYERCGFLRADATDHIRRRTPERSRG